VNKIFGPGNQYVMAAKRSAQYYGVAIDMPAGPSELLVIADWSCNPRSWRPTCCRKRSMVPTAR